MAVTTLAGRLWGLLKPVGPSRGPGGRGCLRLLERLADCPLCPQVCERPLMFLLDTPGVLAPRIQSVETGLKLALCGEPAPHNRPPGPQAGRLVPALAWLP